jgi:hypothetical protein
MITIDKLEPIIEKVNERLRGLNFVFHDKEIGKEAEDAKDEAIAALENYLELATQDWENRPDTDKEDGEDET